MHGMLRGLAGLAFSLCAWAGPAAAMDPSATEETNCLMACDANQENCMGTTLVTIGRSRLSSETRQTRSPRSLRATANFSQIDRVASPKERLR